MVVSGGSNFGDSKYWVSIGLVFVQLSLVLVLLSFVFLVLV